MKIAGYIAKEFFMFSFFLTVVLMFNVGCKTIHEASAMERISTPAIADNPSLYFPSFTPKRSAQVTQADTSRKKRKELFDERFFARADKSFNSIDEILKLNIELQKRYFRIADTARNRKTSKDSVVSLLVAVRDTLNAANTRSTKYYEAAKRANYFQRKVETSDKIDNSMFWTGVGIIVVFGLGRDIIIYWIQNRRSRKLFKA